jgi:hypothetical protein
MAGGGGGGPEGPEDPLAQPTAPSEGHETTPRGGEEPPFLARMSISDSLREELKGAIPLPVAEAVLSPLVIAEFLFRSVLGSAVGYLIPLLLAGVYGLWLTWKMRREVGDDELALPQ